jgi:hypothetical protein
LLDKLSEVRDIWLSSHAEYNSNRNFDEIGNDDRP